MFVNSLVFSDVSAQKEKKTGIWFGVWFAVMDSLDSAEAINFCQGTLSESSAEAAISIPDTFCV